MPATKIKQINSKDSSEKCQIFYVFLLVHKKKEMWKQVSLFLSA